MKSTANILLLAILLALVSCNNRQQAETTDIASPVSVEDIKKQSIEKYLNTTGTAKATQEVTLSTEMAGLYRLQNNPVTGRPFKLGDRVKAGQVIAKLDDQEYVNGIAIDAQKLNLEIAEQEYEKQKSLYEKGGVTLRELRNSEVSAKNAKYNYDKYFAGLEFDLSKVLFIFTYNDASKVDPILADRLFKIRVDNYSIQEKMEITKTHLINTIFKEYCFTNQDIQFEESAINYIVESSRSDQGMRDIKRKFEIVISRVNTLLLTDPEEDIIRLKYKSLYSHYKQDIKPVKILREHIDVFLSDSITEDKNDSPPPGMYI